MAALMMPVASPRRPTNQPASSTAAGTLLAPAKASPGTTPANRYNCHGSLAVATPSPPSAVSSTPPSITLRGPKRVASAPTSGCATPYVSTVSAPAVDRTVRSRCRSASIGRRNAASEVRLPAARMMVTTHAASARQAPASSTCRRATRL
jgi:hypothetical protein